MNDAELAGLRADLTDTLNEITRLQDQAAGIARQINDEEERRRDEPGHRAPVPAAARQPPQAEGRRVSDSPDPLRRSLRTGVVITSAIGGATAVYSFHDALIVAHHAGERGDFAYLVPLFADGLIALCSTALYAAAQAKVRRPWAGMTGLVFGIAVTVLLNIAAGAYTGKLLALIDGLAPVVFLIALEILVWQFRLGRRGQQPDKPAQCPHGVPSNLDEAVRLDFEHRRDCLKDKPSYLQHGARWGIDRRRVPELVGAGLNGDGHAP